MTWQALSQVATMPNMVMLPRYETIAVSPVTRRHILPNYQGSITTVTDSAGNGIAIAINRYDGVAGEGAKRGQFGSPASTNIGRFQYSAARAMPGCIAKQGPSVAARDRHVLLQSPHLLPDAGKVYANRSDWV